MKCHHFIGGKCSLEYLNVSITGRESLQNFATLWIGFNCNNALGGITCPEGCNANPPTYVDIDCSGVEVPGKNFKSMRLPGPRHKFPVEFRIGCTIRQRHSAS